MLIALVGATGTGKSALSIRLAQAFAARGVEAEVVNADAMQLYRGMDIGTAKLTVAERAGVPHHLFDTLDVTEDASVAEYQRQSHETIAEISARGAWPILVGGSGLYASAALFGFDFPATDPLLRAELEALLETGGPSAVFATLTEVDADAAATIGPHNGRRLVRALEVVTLTGKPFAASLPSTKPLRPSHLVHVREERGVLTERLDRRVAEMWQSGMLDETERLRDAGLERGTTARQAIGYTQALAQLRGDMTEAEAIAATASLTRRYARRQVSWFQRYDAEVVMSAAIAEGAAGALAERVLA